MKNNKRWLYRLKFNYITQFFLVVFFLVFVFTSSAQAMVVFEDNFDSQPDWQPSPGTNDESSAGASSECNQGDCSGQVPTGWSYYRSTGLWWGPNYQDTIRVNSDNYHGINGKAYTQWNESNVGASGDGWGADGILSKYFATDYPELYVQFWMRMDPNFQWDTVNDAMLKIFRIKHYDGAGSTFLGFTSGNASPIYLFDLKNSINWGWRHSHSFRCDPQESDYYCPDGDEDNDLFLNSSTNPWDAGQPADGDWHKYTFHIKINTHTLDWNQDGILEFWYDGILKYGIYNKRWIVSGNNYSLAWNSIGLGGNAYNNYADESAHSEQWYSIDDVCVTTTQADLNNCFSINSNLRADVDNNSQINTTDAMLTLRNSVNLDMSGTDWQASATTGDADCDGNSNSTDAMLTLRYSLGLNMSGTGWCID